MNITANTEIMMLSMSSGYARQGANKVAADDQKPAFCNRDTDINLLLTYLQRTRVKAESIRENAPSGSYLDSVLSRTIAGLDTEIASLRYLCAAEEREIKASPKRMRQAL
ncbi:hypothetical protein [Roseibium litorale]|uniref:Uncharacterized protein n=1 Tax=Roseibium litorale TaxID=2803841 RepID=A0ABR9CSG1_9HYPH|nr:hypothetical protein [Roseibium litorale]MBD8893217.1 hypothetical protein [Roseibium litorale]